MKTPAIITSMILAGLSLASVPATAAPQPATATERVGVYDSRAVAYAHFWSTEAQAERGRLIEDARAARTAGEPAKSAAAEKLLAAHQERIHLQVFSTAPATEALEALRERLPVLQRELGVARFVSRWDDDGLRGVAEAQRIDVTDRLVDEFRPDQKRRETIAQIRAKSPVPLWRMKLLLKLRGA